MRMAICTCAVVCVKRSTRAVRTLAAQLDALIDQALTEFKG